MYPFPELCKCIKKKNYDLCPQMGTQPESAVISNGKNRILLGMNL